MMLYENIDPKVFDGVFLTRMKSPSITYQYELSKSDLRMGIKRDPDIDNQ